MKFTIIYTPDCQATQDLIEQKCKSLNEDFRNEYAGFLRLYNKIPESVRKRLPWNDIMEYRASAIILDDFKITEMKPIGEKQCYELIFNFNETTLEAFSVIAPHLERMIGSPIRGLTRKALKHKIRKDLEAGGNVKILNYWEGEAE